MAMPLCRASTLYLVLPSLDQQRAALNKEWPAGYAPRAIQSCCTVDYLRAGSESSMELSADPFSWKPTMSLSEVKLM